MIETNDLNDVSVEEIFDEAKNQVLYQSTDWTNFQESDPGVTLLELFSWLKGVQHEYLNRIPEGIRIKFLNLLDVSPYKNKGSETLLQVSGIKKDIELPIRTKWKSKSMAFENLNQQALIKSKILSLVFENPEIVSEEEYYKFDGKKSFFLFGKDIDRKNDKNQVRRFTINFDAPLPKNSIINLYFSVHVSKGLKRNPINPEDEFESMAEVRWEYYGKENGKIGWHEAQVINDETHNFLFSGITKLSLKGKSMPIEEEYKLRAVLEYDEYDYPPRIDNVLTNVFRTVQNNTRCENIVVKKEDILTNRTVKIRSNLALYGENEVYFKKHDGWVRSYIPTIEKKIDKGEVILNLKGIWNEIKVLKHDCEAIMMVSYEKDIEDKIVLGSATGISGQNFEIGFENILLDGIEIMISEKVDGDEVFYKWKLVDNFFSSNKYDRHYMLNKIGNIVIFGDHDHGMAPRKGINNIRICLLRETLGENSNTKENTVHSVETENEALKDCRIVQIKEAVGGVDEETMQHAQARAAEIFNNPQRAVTMKDYENIVRSTPGLMFSNVKVLPNYMPGQDVSKQNCVTIAVRWNRKIGLTLPKSFEKNIMCHLEKYRLINTKVKIVSPEYVGLNIGGVVVVNSSYRVEEGRIEEEIKKFITEINKEMGRTLHFGDLFGMIDRLEYVSSLNKLVISAVGENSQKNASEDIEVPPNAVYYVEKTDFSFIRSSEIYRS